MTAKAENVFRRSVHGYLDLDLVHQEKMANPYSSGTADDWYSGRPQRLRQKTRDLWIEWKFLELPKRDDTMIDLVSGKDPDISVLQQRWLKERFLEGRHVWVGVGCKDGAVIFKKPAEWLRPISTGSFKELVISRAATAKHITEFVQGAS